jgi:hypothetical protein
MPAIPVNLQDVSLTRPVVADGNYPCTITEFEFKKAGTGAQMFAARNDLVAEDGSKFSIFENIVIVNKDGARNEPGLRRLKNIITQLLGEDAANDPEFDTDSLIGVQSTAVVTSRKGKDQDGEDTVENRIKRYVVE